MYKHTIILTLMSALLATAVLAQPLRVAEDDAFTKTLKVNRINLKEKGNAEIRDLPHVLLTAYRMGYIDGMFPNTHDGPMDWQRFMEVYEIDGHQFDLVGDEDACCTPSDLPQPNWRPGKELDTDALKSIRYPGFDGVCELIEAETFDKNDSRNKWETQYIRLVWVDPQRQMGARNAVLFRYEDVFALLSQLKGFHLRNEAAALSYRQLIDNRRFSTYPVEVSGKVLMSMEEATARARRPLEQQEERISR